MSLHPLKLMPSLWRLLEQPGQHYLPAWRTNACVTTLASSETVDHIQSGCAKGCQRPHTATSSYCTCSTVHLLAAYYHYDSDGVVVNEWTRHRASTSMYSLTFRVRVATPTRYGRNGTASLQITSRTQQARRFYRWCVRACVVRAVGLADYHWALPRIS